MDFNQIQAAASAATAKDHFELDEGEALVLLIPFPRGWENGRTGIPWVTHFTVQHDDVFAKFKRPIMSPRQPYCQTDFYKEAAQKAGKLETVDVLTALVDTQMITEADADTHGKEKGIGRELCGWAVCKIADRRRDKDPWSFAYEKPQVARFTRGGATKPAPQRIIETALAAGHGPRMMGELSEALDVLASGGELPEGSVHAQLIRLTRAGKGKLGTTYGGGLVESGEYANFEIPSTMLDEIVRAIQPGGYCDLHTYFAERSIPSEQEIERVLYGKGGDASDKPSMQEV